MRLENLTISGQQATARVTEMNKDAFVLLANLCVAAWSDTTMNIKSQRRSAKQ